MAKLLTRFSIIGFRAKWFEILSCFRFVVGELIVNYSGLKSSSSISLKIKICSNLIILLCPEIKCFPNQLGNGTSECVGMMAKSNPSCSKLFIQTGVYKFDLPPSCLEAKLKFHTIWREREKSRCEDYNELQ